MSAEKVHTAASDDVANSRFARAIVAEHGAAGVLYLQERAVLEAFRENPDVDQKSVMRFAAAERVRDEAAQRGEELSLLDALRILERRA